MPKHAALSLPLPRRGRTRTLIVLLCILIALYTAYRFTGPFVSAAPDPWQAIICDVGQGSAALIRTEAHRAILVDTGSRGENLTGCLDWAQVDEIEAVIISHAHEDHMGNIAATYPLLAQGKETAIFCSSLMNQDCDLTAVAPPPVPSTQIDARHNLTRGDGQLSFLWPISNLPPTVDSSQINNQSVIVHARAGYPSGSSPLVLLLPGDAEEDALMAALGPYTPEHPLTLDLLVLPHHGSRTSGEAYLHRIDTSYAAVSVAEQNSYGHPHPEVMRQVNNTGVTTVSTADHGHLAFWKEQTRLEVAAERN